MNRLNVLVSQISYFSSIGIIKLLRRLKWGGLKIVGTSYFPLGMTSGSILVDTFYESPRIFDDSYLAFIASICKKERVDIIISPSDDELILLSENIRQLPAKVICADTATLRMLCDKLNASVYMSNHGIPVPRIIQNLCTEIPPDGKIIFRGRKSVGSKMAYSVNLNEEKYIENHFSPDYFVQEHIDGKEYTVDILCDTNGEIKLAIPRQRIDIRNGISYKCVVEYIPEIVDVCVKIYQYVKIPGLSNVQFIFKNNVPYFIELNPRFAGTGIASSLASFNVLDPYLKHFCFNEPLMEYSNYMGFVAWDSIITRFYDETVYTADTGH